MVVLGRQILIAVYVFTFKYVGGWVGRWCWVASSAGASYYFGIW